MTSVNSNCIQYKTLLLSSGPPLLGRYGRGRGTLVCRRAVHVTVEWQRKIPPTIMVTYKIYVIVCTIVRRHVYKCCTLYGMFGPKNNLKTVGGVIRTKEVPLSQPFGSPTFSQNHKPDFFLRETRIKMQN